MRLTFAASVPKSLLIRVGMMPDRAASAGKGGATPLLSPILQLDPGVAQVLCRQRYESCPPGRSRPPR